MRKPRAPEDLTIEELRRLLMDKRRQTRQEHLERFRRTGRVVMLASDEPPAYVGQANDAMPREPEARKQAPPLRRRLVDSFSLVVELAAVLALLVIVFNSFQAWQKINAETLQSQALPTLTPTPRILAVVLPSGHTPPNSPGGAAPNEAEIPEHLRPLVQQFASLPLPTPSVQQAIRIQIAAIGIDAPIVQGDGWEQLKKGVGQHIGSANPGENGNLVLSAHNDVFGEYFRDLDRLKVGDQIIVYSNQRAHIYVVTGSEIVEPTRVEVMAATSEPVVTLISCYPYLVNNKRIVVRAALQP